MMKYSDKIQDSTHLDKVRGGIRDSWDTIFRTEYFTGAFNADPKTISIEKDDAGFNKINFQTKVAFTEKMPIEELRFRGKTVSYYIDDYFVDMKSQTYTVHSTFYTWRGAKILESTKTEGIAENKFLIVLFEFLIKTLNQLALSA